MRKCESCGKLYQESKDVFCPHCGAVAQKQCTHGSSFDSSRYDRGEIYKNEPRSTAYTHGVEPHIQREKYPYNSFEDTFGDAGQYSDETPRKSLFPDIGKVLSNGKNSGKKNNIKIGAIISGIIILLNFITGMLAINDTDFDDVFYEDASEIYIAEDGFYPVSSSASVTLLSANGASKKIEIAIDDMYFPYENADSSSEIRESILKGNALIEMEICTFSETEISEEDYNVALEESYYISSNYVNESGHCQFTCEFEYGEIVHIIGGVSMYLGNGMYVNTELPFGAFSIAEDGAVTYYTSYADDSTDWNTVFTECSNEMAVNDYSAVITFDDEE